MTTEGSYTGDLTLEDQRRTPVAIDSPENVYVLEGAVEGDLFVHDPEYVFTGQTVAGDADADVATPAEAYEGSLEDAYLGPGGVDGDVVVRHAEDVFVAPDAVAGEVRVRGAERTFDDAVDPLDRRDYDETLTGWQRSLTVEDPDRGVAVAGGRNDLTVDVTECDVEVLVLGWANQVQIEGRASAVDLHLVGAENDVEVSPYVDLEVRSDCGVDNDASRQPVPVEDLIRTTESEAYAGILFGRRRVSYQEPATDEEYCPSCGADVDAIVARRSVDAFFVVGIPVYSFEPPATAHECAECSPHAHPGAELTEAERRDLFE